MNVRWFLCVADLSVLLLVPVYAADSAEPALDEAADSSVAAPPSLVVQGPAADELAAAISQALAGFSYEGELDSVRAIPVPSDSGIAPVYDKDDTQTAEPSGTLKSILVKLLGPYNPVVVEYRYQNYNQSSYSYVREIQPDYVWCASAALFVLLVFCTFRLGGALLRKL